ncbi:energy transducer TonB [Hymenobacter metallilatus]|uniref:Energy transducer TonB n=1 Tax=Hymenobacter metallilatus TaxID=2493666 RepID=A0A3R9M582_9BACT|nr:energy transducer TonB [Hymenobacter metallilatus]RSK37420.1 energy transducer TonB [Hymenobacter metallilatus]
MLPLPILNIRLQACAEDWQQMTPTEQGHYCGSCRRTVLDFTQATQSDLEAAFLHSPDGRVCGRFRAEQLAPAQPAPLPRRVALRPRLRRFLVALLLVCGLGLSAREAVGQVRKVAQTTSTNKPAQACLQQLPGETEEIPDKSTLASTESAASAPLPFLGSVKQMPVFKGGMEALMKFIAANFHRPAEAPATLAGKVFVRFQITETGAVRDVQVAKGLHPALDAEAVRVVKLLDGKFTPGQQNKRPVAVGYTIPFTFQSTSTTLPVSRKRK